MLSNPARQSWVHVMAALSDFFGLGFNFVQMGIFSKIFTSRRFLSSYISKADLERNFYLRCAEMEDIGKKNTGMADFFICKAHPS